jgi:anti-sigma regulatory factor (Ser/Thr protein kinase)
MLKKNLTIPATLRDVSQFTAELETWFTTLNMESRVSIVLAVQELCVNIVKHAYQFTEGEIQIQIDWRPGQLRFQFVDHAPHRFVMPEVVEAPDPLDLPESGMGLYLIHQAFDQVDYSVHDHQNHWRLFKQLE